MAARAAPMDDSVVRSVESSRELESYTSRNYRNHRPHSHERHAHCGLLFFWAFCQIFEKAADNTGE
jgi:hypothetical protein